jgi:hypothetical protein
MIVPGTKNDAAILSNGVGNQDRCHKASVFVQGPS